MRRRLVLRSWSFFDVMFGFFLLSYVGLMVFEAWTRWKYHLGLMSWFVPHPSWKIDDPMVAVEVARLMVLAGAGLVFGSGRLVDDHPAFSWEYREWLRLTPWHSRMPLPFGQLAIKLRDGWLPVIVVLLCGGDWALSLLLLICVVLGFVLATIAVCVRCRLPWHAQSLVLGLSFVVHTLWDQRILSAVLAVGVYLFSLIVLRRSLEGFPWDFLPKPFQVDPRPYQRIGWPWENLLRPKFAEHISLAQAVSVSLLSGWSVFVLGEWFVRLGRLRPHHAPQEEDIAVLFVSLFGIVGAVARLGKYLTGFWWTTGLTGRWATGRWLLPGFDTVLIAPLLAPISGFATYQIVVWLSDSKPLAFGVAVAVMLLLLLAAGPTERDWKLTGHHRVLSYGSNPNRGNRVEEI